MSIQQITITGRLTSDAETKEFGQHTALTCSVAVNQYNGRDRDETTVFYDVKKFGPGVEGLSKILRKGRVVTVVGELKVRVAEPSEKYPNPRTFYNIDAAAIQPPERMGGDDFPGGDDGRPSI